MAELVNVKLNCTMNNEGSGFNDGAGQRDFVTDARVVFRRSASLHKVGGIGGGKVLSLRDRQLAKPHKKSRRGVQLHLPPVEVLDDGEMQVLFPLPLALHGVVEELSERPVRPFQQLVVQQQRV